jgi:integrase/recombinase XerC
MKFFRLRVPVESVIALVLMHSFATHLLKHDAGIVAVSKLLGHSKLSTTERYTHLSPATMMKAYHGAFPQTRAGGNLT